MAPGGGLGRQQCAVERRPSPATDARPRGSEARGADGWGWGPASEPALDTPTSRGRSRDPNKGGRRIKGGGAESSGLRVGDQIPHQAARGLCALERDGEPRPPAAPKSFSLRLPRGDRSAPLGGCSPWPLRRASLPRPRLSPLSLASRGECDGRWAPSGCGLGDALLRGAGQVLRAAPTPACAGRCVKFSRAPASPGCGRRNPPAPENPEPVPRGRSPAPHQLPADPSSLGSARASLRSRNHEASDPRGAFRPLAPCSSRRVDDWVHKSCQPELPRIGLGPG